MMEGRTLNPILEEYTEVYHEAIVHGETIEIASEISTSNDDCSKTWSKLSEDNFASSRMSDFTPQTLDIECKVETANNKVRQKASIDRSFTSADMDLNTEFTAAEYHCCPGKIKKNKIPSVDSNDNKSYSSILQRPFVFRRAESLDKAMKFEEERLKFLYRQSLRYPPQEEHGSLKALSGSSISSTESFISTSSSKSSLADTSTPEPGTQLRAQYLLTSIPEVGEGEYEGDLIPLFEEAEIKKQEVVAQESAAMTQAQLYLRVHRIFEFFQFLIAHLLSALPENPIRFLLELLDKCLMYRSGLGPAPLLYDKAHLEVLFDMMDRMKTGFIDMQQYAAAMKTLGICGMDDHLQRDSNVVIQKDRFVEDVLALLLSNLNDLIRRKYLKGEYPIIQTPPPTPMPHIRSKTSQNVEQRNPTKSNEVIESAMREVLE